MNPSISSLYLTIHPCTWVDRSIYVVYRLTWIPNLIEWLSLHLKASANVMKKYCAVVRMKTRHFVNTYLSDIFTADNSNKSTFDKSCRYLVKFKKNFVYNVSGVCYAVLFRSQLRLRNMDQVTAHIRLVIVRCCARSWSSERRWPSVHGWYCNRPGTKFDHPTVV